MTKHVSLFRSTGGIALIAAMLATTIPTVFAQQKDTSSAKRKDKREPTNAAYRQWLDDVQPIITNNEHKIFDMLKTDEERDEFINLFWRNRDPDPETPENEYRDEYYRRIQYANEKFSSGIPGWKTDRGRIYIKFGKPDEIESHPAGGTYERPSYEGGGSTSTYPFEIWWYRNIDGVGSDVEIEFVDPSGSGNYRIAQNPNEKDALLMVRGAGATLAESLGMASKADRIAGANEILVRAKDQPFERLQRLADLEKTPAVRTYDPRIKADVPEVAADILPFSVRTDFFRLSADSVVSSLTMQFDHSDLSFKNVGGIYSGQVNIYAHLTAISARRAGNFEDVVQTSRYAAEQLASGQQQKSIYQKNLVLQPGGYKLDVVARDTVSGKTGVLHHSFEVPRYQEDSLGTSTLILATSIKPLDNTTIPAGQFIIGRYKVMPYVSGVYKPGMNLALFLQVYDAGLDQSTLQPALRVEYYVSRSGQEIFRVTEDGKSMQGIVDLKGRQLVVARAIPLQDKLAEAGTYTVTVKITDLVSQKVVTPQAQYTVVEK